MALVNWEDMPASVPQECPYQLRCRLMTWFKEGKRGERPDGFYYITEEYAEKTCNTKGWRSCSEQFTYWKEDNDKRFTEKKICDKCGQNVKYDPVGKVMIRHWCKKKEH
jgi:hypothetical protein